MSHYDGIPKVKVDCLPLPARLRPVQRRPTDDINATNRGASFVQPATGSKSQVACGACFCLTGQSVAVRLHQHKSCGVQKSGGAGYYSDMSSKDAKPRSQKQLGTIGKLYLLAYNGVQTIGWSYLLWQTSRHFLNRGTLDTFWDEIKWTVVIFQNAAVFEVLHAAIGLVPSGVFLTLAQVYSRVFLVCGALLPTRAAQLSPGLPLCAVAWSLAEIVRYSYYALNLVGAVPRLLLTLRYSLFLVLYPLGISGELLCMYYTLKEIADRQLWSFSMPNSWNFAFSYAYFMVAYMLLYIPMSPVLYGHMVRQRAKMLGKKKE